jgi:hypothetical protein
MRTAPIIGALMLALSFCGVARAQDPSLEQAVKATYLYKLAPFVEWPDVAFNTPTAPVQICIAGQDPFGALLDQAVAGQRVGVRAIEIHRIARVERSSNCHVLYAGGTPTQSVEVMLRTVRGTPILTVTDGPLPPDQRGIVHFVVQGGRVRFELDDLAASNNSLTLSAKLLSLAAMVRHRA